MKPTTALQCLDYLLCSIITVSARAMPDVATCQLLFDAGEQTITAEFTPKKQNSTHYCVTTDVVQTCVMFYSFVTPEITVTGEKPQFGMTTTSDVSNLAKVLNGVI